MRGTSACRNGITVKFKFKLYYIYFGALTAQISVITLEIRGLNFWWCWVTFVAERVKIPVCGLHSYNRHVFSTSRFGHHMYHATSTNILEHIIWRRRIVEFCCYSPVALPHKVRCWFWLPVACEYALLVASNSTVSCGINIKF